MEPTGGETVELRKEPFAQKNRVHPGRAESPLGCTVRSEIRRRGCLMPRGAFTEELGTWGKTLLAPADFDVENCNHNGMGDFGQNLAGAGHLLDVNRCDHNPMF